MVAVAVAALLLGGEVLRRKRSAYLNRSNAEAASGWGLLTSAEIYERAIRTSADPSVAARYRRRAGLDRELAVYHDGLRRKYERAVRYPWLPVEPDPPMPE